MIDIAVRPGMVCCHHSGRVYTVTQITNCDAKANDPKFPITVVYMGANGLEWSRPLNEFVQKFDVLFDGKNLATNSLKVSVEQIETIHDLLVDMESTGVVLNDIEVDLKNIVERALLHKG